MLLVPHGGPRLLSAARTVVVVVVFLFLAVSHHSDLVTR